MHCGFSSTGAPFDVTAALCGLGAAVIGVQEAWQPASDGPVVAGQRQPADHLTAAATALGATLYRAPLCSRQSVASLGVTTVSGPGELSIAVLTTLPVTDYEVVELGLAPGDQVPRLAQIVWLELPAGPHLRLVNTHLTHKLTSPLQLRRLDQRLRPASASRRRPVPTIIIGDLNMPRMVAARWAGYRDLIRGRTWPAGRPLLQLDHMLASRGIDRLGGAVLPPAGSDHLPVRARVRVPGQIRVAAARREMNQRAV